MNHRRHRQVFQILVPLAILVGFPTMALAQIDAYVKVLSIGNETKFYGAINPTVRPGNSWLPFLTASVSSQDGLFRTQTQGNLWAYPENEPLFATREALIDAMQQPYTMLLDEGLPTQRIYRMNFDAGVLPTMGIQAPRILYPVDGSTDIDATLRIESSYTGSPSEPALSQGIISQGSDFVATTSIYRISPPVTLLPGRQYKLDAYSRTTTSLNFGFARPIDENGEPFSGYWRSGGRLQYEAISRFRTIPEPNTLTTTTVALVTLAVYASRKRRNRQAARPRN